MYPTLRYPLALLILLAVLAGCASDDSRSAGRETGSVGKQAVEAGKEVGREVKDASKQAWEDIKSFGRGVKEGWKNPEEE